MNRATRRMTLAGTASSVALPWLGARAAASDVDVVVVGAGAAGLAAATRLLSLHRTVVVLEARGRIGGRAWTDRSLGVPFDAGARWIQWADKNPWVGIAASLSIPTSSSPGPFPGFVVVDGGRPVPSDEQTRRRRAIRDLDDALEGWTGEPDRSVAEVARTLDPSRPGAAERLTIFELGEEPERVSAADYSQLWSGQDQVVPAGYGTLVERYGAALPVRTGQAVRSLDRSGPGVRVETAGGVTVAARAALVTVPVGSLRHGDIAFRPGLPPATLAALEGLAMGAYTKVALKLDRAARDLPYGLDIGAPGLMAFEPHPEAGLVVCLLGGDSARVLCEAGEAEALAHVRARVGTVYGADVARSVSRGALAGWWTDPFSRGSYAVVRPGAAGARRALRQPIDDRVWFAGEATAGGGSMTVGGAWLEGNRAAEEVHRALGPA